MVPQDRIHFIITGGTIDSYYHVAKDTVVPRKISVVPNYIELVGLKGKSVFTQICMKDSRNLEKSDLKKVLETVRNGQYKKIIITHGTYTMPDTVRFLEANLGKTDKTIILTGSLIPMEGFTPSDAPFNLGFSIAKLDSLSPGVYISMHGKIFLPKEVAKNMGEGKFYSIFGEK